MLQVRQEQIDVLNDHAQEVFERRLAEYFRRPRGDLAGLARFDALALVQHTVTMADAYGIEADDDITALGDVYRRLGWGFEDEHEFEDLASVLRAPTLSGYAKIELLNEQIAHTGM